MAFAFAKNIYRGIGKIFGPKFFAFGNFVVVLLHFFWEAFWSVRTALGDASSQALKFFVQKKKRRIESELFCQKNVYSVSFSVKKPSAVIVRLFSEITKAPTKNCFWNL